MAEAPGKDVRAKMIERKLLCVSSGEPGVAAHHGDKDFRSTVQRHYPRGENNAAEKLMMLKAKLRVASTEDFWLALMEGMTDITDAQYGFVAKRILVDDEDSAIEMPPIGQPGSCLLGVAFFYNDGHKVEGYHRDYKYIAYGAPCAHMRHDKVFLVPTGLNEFITENVNNFPFPQEAYLGIPLFSEGKCFAHFGMMWTKEGLAKMDLSWGYVEMLLHSLEDLIVQRLVDGQGFSKPVDSNMAASVIPQDAVTASQSLKPYARSLSHELRTPMQGVVGMLDVMHATVQESLEGQSDPNVRTIFKTLRENIEVVQDSSRRAVEAADNVVHAYDLNMQVPDTPVPPMDDDSVDVHSNMSGVEKRPNILIEGNNIPIKRAKRRRSTSIEWNTGPATKHNVGESTSSTPNRSISPRMIAILSAVEESGDINSVTSASIKAGETLRRAGQPNLTAASIELALEASDPESTVTPGFRHTKIRELLHVIINESLRMGGRPDSAIAEDTDRGEIIEVRTKTSKGDVASKMIEWSVDPSVPETVFVDERDLAKLVSCVFLNAIKFTETGKITLKALLSPKSRYVVINVTDTGPGIPKAFLPELFKPFSREDDSLTRQKEGLGLGLLVAKGLARRIGGDLICVRSDTSGSQRGSEFELRVPISSPDHNSRASTPSRSPTPSRARADESLVPIKEGRHTSPLDRRRTSRHGTSGKTKTPDASAFAKATSPLVPSSPSRRNSLSQGQASADRRASVRKTLTFDRNLAKKHPLTFLVAEDNKINRKLLVNMLSKFGYDTIHEAYDGADAVRQMAVDRAARKEDEIDVVLMDLWMPNMDGYEATEKILAMDKHRRREKGISREDDDDRARRKQDVTVLAVSADVTDEALERAKEVGMEGFMTKPYKLMDLERLILEYCAGERDKIEVDDSGERGR